MMTDLLDEPLRLRILTPSGEIYSGEGSMFTFRSSEGDVAIEPGYESSLFDLVIYEARFMDIEGEEQVFALHGGFMKVVENEIILLPDASEIKTRIDESRAKKAHKRAQERIEKNRPDNNIDLKRAELALKRAITRINVTTEVKPPE